MYMKTIFIAAATAAITTTASAQSVIDTTVANLSAQGFTRFQVQQRMNGYRVTANGPDGRLVQFLADDGTVVRERSGQAFNSPFRDDDHRGGRDDDDHGRRMAGGMFGDDDHGGREHGGRAGGREHGGREHGGDDHGGRHDDD